MGSKIIRVSEQTYTELQKLAKEFDIIFKTPSIVIDELLERYNDMIERNKVTKTTANQSIDEHEQA